MPLDELKKQSLDAIFHFDIKEAREISKELEFQIKKLSETSGAGEEFKELSDLLIRLKLLTFPLLKDEEAARLIKESAVKMANDADMDLAERIEARQLTVPESLRMEMVSQPIIEALHENIERIGEGKVFISGENAPVLPTLKNWLLDYDRTFGTGAQNDLAWLEYVKKNAASAKFVPQETETLRKVFKLYERLKREHEIE